MRRTARSLAAAITLTLVAASGGCTATPRQDVDAVMVYVVRHAEAWKNVADAPPDADPDALTPTGEAQARALGRWLAERRPDVVVASDTGRTRATARAIGEAAEVEPRVSVAFGPLRGPALDQRVAEWAAGRDPRPASSDGGPPGESMADGAARARAALEQLAAGGAEAIVVVTHGDLVAAMIGDAAGTAPPERWGRHEVPTGSVSTLHLAHGALSLVSQGHVPGE